MSLSRLTALWKGTSRRQRLLAAGIIAGLVVAAGVTYLLWPTSAGSGTVAAVSAANQISDPSTLQGDSSDQVVPTDVPPSSPPAGSSSTASSLPKAPHAPLTLFRHGSPSKREVALTFDDGPSPFTPQVMAVLLKAHVPATFFCIGRQAAADTGAVASLRKNGFEVENHTWDHPDLTRLEPAAILSELSRTDQALGGAKYLRPPYGNYNADVWDAAHSLGLQLVLWNVDTLDWKYRNVASVLHYLEIEVHPGSIVLMHDGGGDRSQTVAALPQVIAWLRSQGYTFATVNQLLAGVAPSVRRAYPSGGSGE